MRWALTQRISGCKKTHPCFWDTHSLPTCGAGAAITLEMGPEANRKTLCGFFRSVPKFGWQTIFLVPIPASVFVRENIFLVPIPAAVEMQTKRVFGLRAGTCNHCSL